MESLERLKDKLDRLIASYELLQGRNDKLRNENQDLKNKIAELEKEVARFSAEKSKADKHIGEKNEVAIRRISRLVEKIDQLQSEIEFSWQVYYNSLDLF